jgi:pimeloyl-ACP methyl ester carboxylesterase
MESLAGRQLRAMVGATTFATRADVREALRRLMASAPAEGAIGALRAMAARADATDLLPTIDVPALVVGGTEDTLTPPDELRELARAIPGGRLELVEGCGHVCAYERPAAFNHVAGELLNGLRYD